MPRAHIASEWHMNCMNPPGRLVRAALAMPAAKSQFTRSSSTP